MMRDAKCTEDVEITDLPPFPAEQKIPRLPVHPFLLFCERGRFTSLTRSNGTTSLATERRDPRAENKLEREVPTGIGGIL